MKIYQIVKVILIFCLMVNASLFAYIKDLSVDAKNIVLNNVAPSINTGNTSILNPSIFDNQYKFTASYIPLEYDESINHILFNIPYKDYYFQFNYSNFTSKNVEIWNENNVFIQKDNFSQKLLALSGAKNFFLDNKQITFGAKLNTDSANLGSTKIYSKTYFDFGANTVLDNKLGVGFSILNVGDNDQTKIALGVSKNIFLDWYFSIIKPINANLEYNLAGDYKIAKNFKIFAGIDNNIFDNNMDFLSGVKLGTSFLMKNFSIDLAFAKRGELGFMNYFTFNYVYEFKKDKIKKQENEKIDAPKIQSSDSKKYKIGVLIKNQKYNYIRDTILEYLKYDKNLEIIEPEFTDIVMKKKNYFAEQNLNTDSDWKILQDAKKDLDLQLIVDVTVQDKSANQSINIKYFDVYTKQIFYKHDRQISGRRSFEYQIRNMIFEFLENNKKFIQTGITEKELDRQSKIDEIIAKKKMLELKRKLKFEAWKKFKDNRQARILAVKKEIKLNAIKRFEQIRKTKILKLKKEIKIKTCLVFETNRKKRILEVSLKNLENLKINKIYKIKIIKEFEEKRKRRIKEEVSEL
jgi:hypothetical protein